MEAAPSSAASERRKLFVGRISSETGEELLERYFAAYGEVREVVVIRDRETNRGKGYAFVQFTEPAAAEAALMVERHVIGDRTVEVNWAKPRSEQNQRHQYPNQSSNQGRGPNRSSTGYFVPNNDHILNGNSMAITKDGQNKIFVGGLPDTLTEEDFRRYFENFGTVTDAAVIYDNISRRPRGFGFITFESAESFHAVLQSGYHQLNGKNVEVKKAVPKQSHHQINDSHNYNNGTSRNFSGRQNGFNGYQDALYLGYHPQYIFSPGYAPSIYSPYYYNGYNMGSCGGYRFAVPSSSPWKGQGRVALSHNAVPYGNTAPYPRDTNAGYDNTMNMTTGGFSVVASSSENNLEEGEMARHTTGGYSVVTNSSENNVNEGETGKQTTGGYSVPVNSNGNNLDDGETGKQTTGEYIVAANSSENNLEEDEHDKKTNGEYTVVANSRDNNLEEGEAGKLTTGGYSLLSNSSENNLDEGDADKQATSVGDITTQS